MKIINVQEGFEDVTNWGNIISSPKIKSEKKNTRTNKEKGKKKNTKVKAKRLTRPRCVGQREFFSQLDTTCLTPSLTRATCNSPFFVRIILFIICV